VSRHWNPEGASSARWLSDAEYRALSSQERRALHFKRSLKRHEARYRPTPARYRKGYYARQQQAWLLGILVFGPIVGFLSAPILALIGARLPNFTISTPAQTSAPVTASFDYCQWGGGTNCVVDGDTFWIGGEKVRIANIDAPETHPSRCAEEARLGNAATDKLHDLLNSGAVTMTSIDRDRDVYGRLLRNVAVNGSDVGEALVSAGVAREYGSGRRPWC
jgi:endonuclease YncB( thermonuclease family)